MEERNYGELVQRAKAGDILAFEEIYKNCYTLLCFTCKPLCDNQEDIEEIVQDTFLRAFKKLNQLDDDTRFLHWIQKIAINKCYRKYNDAKKDRENLVYLENPQDFNAEEFNKEFLPEDYFEDAVLRKELFKIIEDLPKVQKRLIHLYYYVGMNSREIASLNGCHDGYVRRALSTARNTIKEKIEAKGIASAAFVPLGVVFRAEESAFAAEYVATNATVIASTAVSTVGAVTKTTMLSKIAICAVATACVATVGLATLGLYNTARTTDYPVIETNYLNSANAVEFAQNNNNSDILIVEENQDNDYQYQNLQDDFEYQNNEYQHNYYENHINNPQHEHIPYETYYIDSNDMVENIDNEQYPVILDRTAEILAELSMAVTRSSVNEIIRRYGFVRIMQVQGSFGEELWFYATNEGSGDILIGIREYEDDFLMRFRFFEGNRVNMQHLDFIRFLEP